MDRRALLAACATLPFARAWAQGSAAPAAPARDTAPIAPAPGANRGADKARAAAPTAVPGGVARLDLGGAEPAPRARLDDRRLLVLRDAGRFSAHLGVPLAAAAGSTLTVQVERDGRAPQSITVRVRAKRYATQQLKVPPSQVDLSPEDLARFERERAHLQRVIRTFSEEPPATLAMRQPTSGPRSSSFGLRRMFNGKARNPHNGMDIAAPVGTPVIAPLAGRVIDSGDYFFSGRTLILDHGQGLLTLYAHLDAIDAAPDTVLAAGDILGQVGATGRVTGPHLHFTVYLNATAVDPALFLPPA
jgi:murein DD-endopeptidase MepM/ murein hydrolase activator NlpD